MDTELRRPFHFANVTSLVNVNSYAMRTMPGGACAGKRLNAKLGIVWSFAIVPAGALLLPYTSVAAYPSAAG